MGNDEKYKRILRVIFAECDADDYSVGVMTGEDDNSRWITVTIAKE